MDKYSTTVILLFSCVELKKELVKPVPSLVQVANYSLNMNK
jgi:hypothetical protein